ncbi:xanthine dehydrogenase [Gigaspora margarita]|uniref:Xanthine dehydrogenase n=1 Tax=Gigaspora margarita TaxID=4874 RepID=A0A8H3X345_GIGMA|nr:xanthine dehydrogenase [Gigaspora margarita]
MTNVHSNTAFREFGKPQAIFILESILWTLKLIIEDMENFYIEGPKTSYNQTSENWYLPSVYQQVKKPVNLKNEGRKIYKFNSNSKWRKGGGVEVRKDLINDVVSEALDVPMNAGKFHLMDSAMNLVISTSPTAGCDTNDINGYAVHNACKIFTKD